MSQTFDHHGPSGGDNDGEPPVINYELLLQDALRGLMRAALLQVAELGMLPGEHHFFIGFWTTAPGVEISARLRAQYPEQMVIVLQHQFEALRVEPGYFSVRLHFGGVPETLRVPFEAVFRFEDPSVNFALQFSVTELDALLEDDGEDADDQEDADGVDPEGAQRGQVMLGRFGAASDGENDLEAELADDADLPPGGPGAQVVSLDAFRKK